jgi:hypothetical protein
MVVLHINELLIEPNTTISSIDWEVSTTQDFALDSIIASSYLDTVNKTSIIFENNLDPSLEYYARARALLSTGYTVWGNIDIMTPTFISDLDMAVVIPSLISTPVLISNSDVNNHDVSLFNLSVTGYNTYGPSVLESTSWFIEDMFGNIVWESLNNRFDKESINVNSILLKSKTLYRAHAIFNTNSGDTSRIATYSFVTSSNINKTSITTDLQDLDLNNDNFISFTYSQDISNIYFRIYLVENNNINIVHDNAGSINIDTNNNIFDIVSNTLLKPNKSYFVMYWTNADTNISIQQFTTY